MTRETPLGAVIIDDEYRSRRATLAMITSADLPLVVLGEADGVNQGLEVIEQTNPDLIFLDIEMHDGTGFDLLDRIKHRQIHVIFTTAYDQYAIKAFRYSALDYLLKPIDPELLKLAVQRVLDQALPAAQLTKRIEGLLKSIQSNQPRKLALPSQEGIEYVQFADIYYLEADGNYTTFHLCSGSEVLVTRPIGDYEEILPEDQFFRLHQSYIVQCGSVRKYNKGTNTLILLNDEILPVARRRKKELLQWLAQA